MEIGGTRSFTERMLGAALLRGDVYDEVEADATATPQAAGVVVIVAIAAAIGGARVGDAYSVTGAVAGLVAALVGWLLWSAITYWVGDRLLGGTATWGELLRTIGFAQSPGVLYALGIVPVLGGLAGFLASIWVLVAVIVAISHALDFGYGRAILTALIGWVVYLVLRLLLGWVLGGQPVVV
jgi:hypothetical protein